MLEISYVACNGILFNHESPIRGETFVTRKITRAVSRIAMGIQDKVYLGNLSSKRDWGHAKDYIRAMFLILQQSEPDDYVIATGITTTISDMLTLAFRQVGIDLEFIGKGNNERGVVSTCHYPDYQLPSGKEVVAIDPRYFRPTEVYLIQGNATKASEKLGWVPEYDLQTVIKEMVRSDLIEVQSEKFLNNGGFNVKNRFE